MPWLPKTGPPTPVLRSAGSPVVPKKSVSSAGVLAAGMPAAAVPPAA
jgi:hypothetical protein